MPQDSDSVEEPPSQRLTNDDFRKLLMTPRAPGSGHASGSVREAMASSRFDFSIAISLKFLQSFLFLQW